MHILKPVETAKVSATWKKNGHAPVFAQLWNALFSIAMAEALPFAGSFDR